MFTISVVIACKRIIVLTHS